MTGHRPGFSCTACGARAPRWIGRCTACGAWGSLAEDPAATHVPLASRAAFVHPAAFARPATVTRPAAVPLSEAAGEEAPPVPTGIAELDRVLAGGLVAGSVTLIGGEPGIGKSTLVLQALAGFAGRGLRTLLVAAEESAAQVGRRAERLSCPREGAYVVCATDLTDALEAIAQVAPDVVVVDSIQALGDPTIGSPAGSTTQVRECAAAFTVLAKSTGTAVLLVGHVTKDGSLAGPRALEHLVDTVLNFEGDRHHALRLLTATKHRFGPAGELGLFEMGPGGLRSLEDPSGMLLAGRLAGTPGTVVVPVAEGGRSLLVELQALVSGSVGTPRRVVEGITTQRLALMLAILERSLGASLGSLDVFVSTVGAVRIREPAADLGLGLAVVSALSGLALPPDLAVFGEVGLTGEVRPVPRSERRICESVRLGFGRIIVPPGTAGEARRDGPGREDKVELDGRRSVKLLAARTIGEAADLAGLRVSGATASHAQSSV